MKSRTILCIAVLLSIGCGLTAIAQSDQKPKKKLLRVGIYDSRAIALAYQSQFGQDTLEKMQAELKQAKKEHDFQKMKELMIQRRKQQWKANFQGMGIEQVHECFKPVQDKILAVVQQANVDILIDKWSMNYSVEDVEFIDLTDELTKLYNPDKGTLQRIKSIKKTKPLTYEIARSCLGSEMSSIESSQLIYLIRFSPEPLNQNQLKLLSSWVSDTKPNDVWFVGVLTNHLQLNMLNANIYFLPDYSSGRLRKGKFTRYDSFSFIFFKEASVEKEYDPNTLPKPEYREYVYVLPKYDSPSPNQLPSSESLLPFTVADGFTDEEIVEIVDFVQSQNTLRMKLNDVPFGLYDEFPIMSIWKSQGNIIIYTGYQQGYLSGSGKILTIKKIDDGYVLISRSSWIS